MKPLLKMMTRLRPMGRFGLAVLLVTLALGRSPLARADSLLLASTDLVSGTSAATFSFDAPTNGMVTARLTSLPWPVPLDKLSFSATTATDTLAQWSGSGNSSSAYVETFQVGAGTYFAHVTATAGGDLNLGLYSLLLSFAPSAVPLPAAAGLLLLGALVLFALRGTMHLPPLHPNQQSPATQA